MRKLMIILAAAVLLGACAPAEQHSPQSQASGLEHPSQLNTDPPVLIGGSSTFYEGPAAYYLYGRSLLTEDGAAVYDVLYHAADNLDLEISIPLREELILEAEQVVRWFQYDNPRFYWAWPKVERTGGSAVLLLGSALTVEEIRQREEEINEAAGLLLQGINGQGMDAVTAVHDLLARNVYYNGDPLYNDGANIYGGLVERMAICDGYSRGFQYLMQMQGIPCIYIQGTGPGGAPHSWNAVQLDGSWHYVDVTWDVNKQIRDEIYHDYCGITLQEMERQHYWDRDQYPQLPPSREGQLDYYGHFGFALVYESQEDLTLRLAEVFMAQMQDRLKSEEMNPVYLEIKVLGSSQEYLQVKDHFVGELYGLLAELQAEADRRGLNIQVKTNEYISCSFNDTMQVLTFYPLAKRI